jgi:hypothetical protein
MNYVLLSDESKAISRALILACTNFYVGFEVSAASKTRIPLSQNVKPRRWNSGTRRFEENLLVHIEGLKFYGL